MTKRSNQPTEAETPGVVKVASFAMVPAWLARDPLVTDRAVRLYAVLGSIGPVAFAGWTHLAKLCGDCSVSTIGRAMKVLTEAGAIRITPQFRADGLRRTNEYELARDEPFSLLTPLGQKCTSGPVKSDRPARSNLTAQELEKSDLEKSDLDKPSLDPADQAAMDPPTLTLVPQEEPKPRNVERDLATRYWDWFRAQHGTDPLQEFPAILGLFKRCLKAGWTEAMITRAAAKAGSPLTLAGLQRARTYGSNAVPAWRVTDPTKAAMDDGSYGVPENLRPEPGKSRKLTDDEVRAFALGSSDGRP